MTFKVFIVDLNRYNNNLDTGEWYDLDSYSDYQELLEDAFNDMKEKNPFFEEWEIHDYDVPFDNPQNYGLEALYEIYEKFEQNYFLADSIIEAIGIDRLIECNNIEDWFSLRSDVDNLEKYGIEKIYENGHDFIIDDPYLNINFDYKGYGEDLLKESENEYITSNGLLTENM